MPQENYYKLFEDEMNLLGRRYGLSRVFNDLLTVSMCSVHQTNIASRLTVKDEENEALYMGTIKPYSKEELNTFAKLLSYLTLNAHQSPYSDLLGEYFTEHITQGHNGQYFTPDPVCELMAGLQGADKTVKHKRVADPSCGSGRMLLAFAKVAPNNYFYGNDVSLTCAKMTSLNMMFNGLRGEAACMNTLSMEWFAGWHINIPDIGIKPITKENSQIWSAPPQVPPKSQQLVLF